MPQHSHVTIATPVYNDWDSLKMLIPEIERVAVEHDLHLDLVIINDGSIQSRPALNREELKLKNIERIIVINAACNLGHQKAIALGLAYIQNNLQFDRVIVMDCDGEDQPDDIPRLINEHLQFPDSIIFAQRSHRSESLAFKLFYALYRLSFRILTGSQISFGNFSLLPADLLKRIVYLPSVWNHFAASIIYAKLSWRVLPTPRGHRYTGRSKMNFMALILHGLSAISVFTEVLTVRLIVLSLGIILLDLMGFIALFYVKYFTALAIPGWATSVAIGLFVIMFQAVTFLALFSFIILNYRTSKLFIPGIDYKDYIFSSEELL